jgi:hypothetical protein
MVNESGYADDPIEETHEYQDDEYIASDMLPWWACKAPPLLVSGLLHAVLILISAYLITSYVSIKKKAAILNFFNEPKVEQYNHEAERDIFKNREIIAEIMVEDAVIIHDEEKELTKNIPKGKSPDNLTNINLNGDSISAVYGIGGTPAGACGVPWGKGSLKKEGGSKETERVVDAALRWDPIGEWCVVGGRVYATAINALTLEIYYRYGWSMASNMPARYIDREGIYEKETVKDVQQNDMAAMRENQKKENEEIIRLNGDLDALNNLMPQVMEIIKNIKNN